MCEKYGLVTVAVGSPLSTEGKAGSYSPTLEMATSLTVAGSEIPLHLRNDAPNPCLLLPLCVWWQTLLGWLHRPRPAPKAYKLPDTTPPVDEESESQSDDMEQYEDPISDEVPAVGMNFLYPPHHPSRRLTRTPTMHEARFQNRLSGD